MVKKMNEACVLLVDDERFIRNFVGRLLLDLNIKEVLKAIDGADAVKKLQIHLDHIDLILLDLEMPNMNGFEVVQAIRNGEAGVNSNLPVLILTGHGQEGAVKHAVNLGIHGFIVKPMSKQALENGINAALSGNAIDPEKVNN